MTTNGTSNDNEWQRVLRRVTTSDNKWQQVTMSDATSDNKWHRITTSGTTKKTNESEWEQIKESDFGFRMKQNIQCITTVYSAIWIIHKLGQIDDIYFQYKILRFCHASFSSCFWLSVLLKFIKAC